MKYIDYFKKHWAVETAIFSGFLLLFLLLNWRLFAIGSENQLLMYGDNLTAYNNFYYIFSQFHLGDIFSTFIGKNGMLGSYPLSEPQSSIFYLPVILELFFFKTFHLNEAGLYYELLFVYVLHVIIGTYFIYKIGRRILKLDRMYSILAGLVYMGLGWNAAWFGTLTLAYMIGLLPISFFLFFEYMRWKTTRLFALFVFSLALILYAGGIVNFFFYVMLNFFLLFCGLAYFKFGDWYPYSSRGEVIKTFVQVCILAPVLAVGTYSVQLFNTYRVSTDIFHSSSSYDYLAFYGTHFYDLVGLIVPKFALLDFGSVTNPRIILEFSLANILYVGVLPLLIFALGVICMKNRVVWLFSFMTLFNFLLAFGGAFFLYDATYFFPGNSFFRGHYKYLMLVGIYFSLLVPFILNYWHENFSVGAYRKAIKKIATLLLGLIFLGILAAMTAFTLKVLQKDNAMLASYYSLGMTLTSYLFRMVMMIGLSLLAVYLFVEQRSKMALLFIMFVLIMDTSINYKYTMLSQTPIENLVSKKFFECCEGKTIVNDIDKYTQLYFLPEILGVDVFFQYSAIPNRYMVDYNSHIIEKSGYSYKMLAAAGIEGVLTTNTLSDPRFTQELSKGISRDNFKNLYLYNADGDIHNDWGERAAAIGSKIQYYSVKDAERAYFTTMYKEKSSEEAIWSYLEDDDEFDQHIPALYIKKRIERDRPMNHYVSKVVFLKDRPTYKEVQVKNEQAEGVFFINIPFSTVWKARVNGEERPIYRANGAFSAIKISKEDSKVEIYVDQTKTWFFFCLSFFVSLVLGGVALFPISFSLLSKKVKIFTFH